MYNIISSNSHYQLSTKRFKNLVVLLLKLNYVQATISPLICYYRNVFNADLPETVKTELFDEEVISKHVTGLF